MFKRIRLIAMLCVILFMVCLLGGCNSNSKQLNERMAIQGMGIDYENNEYIVTVMYMNTDEAQQSEGEQQSTQHKLAQGKGKTVTDAVTNIVNSNGLEPLYSHNSFIIFGKDMCKKGLQEPLEFFAGYYQCRPSVNVLVADRQAHEIIKLPKITVDIIESIAESPATTGRTNTTPLYVFMGEIADKSTSATTSLLTVEEKAPKVRGVAVFEKDRLKHTMNTSQALGMLLIRGESDISSEVIPLGNGNKSFALSQESIDSRAYIQQGILHCDITIKGKAKIYEYINNDIEVENKIEDRIVKLAKDTLNECKKQGSDVFYFGKMLRQSDYTQYKKISDWTTLIKNAKFSVDCDVKVK